MRVGEVAKKYSISRSTLYKRINEGLLTATRDSIGKQVVDLGDVARVFNIDTSEQVKTAQKSTVNNVTSSATTSIAELQQALSEAIHEREEWERRARLFKTTLDSMRESYKTLERANNTLIKQLDTQATQHEKTLSIFERMLNYRED